MLALFVFIIGLLVPSQGIGAEPIRNGGFKNRGRKGLVWVSNLPSVIRGTGVVPRYIRRAKLSVSKAQMVDAHTLTCAEEYFSTSSRTLLEQLKRSKGARKRMMSRTSSSSIRRPSVVGPAIGPKPTWTPVQEPTRKPLGRNVQRVLIFLALKEVKEERRRKRNVLSQLERRTFQRLMSRPGDEALMSIYCVARSERRAA